MSLFIILTAILATSLLTCSVLCYALFVLLKKVRVWEELLRESKSVVQALDESQKSTFDRQSGKNPLLLVLSKVTGSKAFECDEGEGDDDDKTLH